MAVNPMQRKARNSFLLGMIIALLITGVIIALLFLQLKKKNDELTKLESLQVNVYTLKQNVKSGDELTENMFSIKQVNSSTIPSNATSVSSVIDTWFLQTIDGEMVYRDSAGLYLDKPDSIIEVTSDNGKYIGEYTGETVSVRNPYTDALGTFAIDSNNDVDTRIYEENGNYFIYKVGADNKSREKKELKMNNVPVLAKIDLKANTVITPDHIVQSDEIVTDDLRKQEYNMIVLPTDLTTNDYIDIRLMLPSGQNFLVISKVKVEIPKNADGTYIPDTIWINLREDEILALSSAIVEAFGIEGAQLYANKYVEPGLQAEAVPTYTPNSAVTAQIDVNGDGIIDNPNIVENAKKELNHRYSEAAKSNRNQYLQSLINGNESYSSNVQSGMDESAAASNETRQSYIESLMEE